MSDPTALDELSARWRQQADGYAQDAALVRGDALLLRVADELEIAWRAWREAELTLAAAAAESGYSRDRLRELIAEGRLPATGEGSDLRVRRCDLPKRPGPVTDVVESMAAKIIAGRHH